MSARIFLVDHPYFFGSFSYIKILRNSFGEKLPKTSLGNSPFVSLHPGSNLCHLKEKFKSQIQASQLTRKLQGRKPTRMAQQDEGRRKTEVQ